MKFIEQNAWQFLSVKLPVLGAFLLLVLIPGLQWAVDFKLIPVEYHAYVTGGVMVFLSWLGKKWYQPELHQATNLPAGRSALQAQMPVLSSFLNPQQQEVHQDNQTPNR